MKINILITILFLGLLSCPLACSNEEKELNNGLISDRPLISFHVEDSTNYEAKMMKMDSLSIAIQNKLCGSKWLLKDFTARGNDYLTNKTKELDSLIFTFSQNGNVFIDKVGLIGQWYLSFYALNTFFGCYLTFFTKNDDICKTFFFKRNFNLVFHNEDKLLVVASVGEKKLSVYRFKRVF